MVGVACNGLRQHLVAVVEGDRPLHDRETGGTP
jgi:hypothetical protein